MKSHELPMLAARLTQLAEYYDKKPPGAAALKVWIEALEAVQIYDVNAVLADWPKTHRSMPLADEVLKLASGRLSDRIEAEAERNRQTTPAITDLAANLCRNLSPEGKRARGDLQRLLDVLKGKDRNPKAWAERLRQREENGDVLNHAQQSAWRLALRVKETEAEREARLEREAIQAEA